MRQSQQPSRKSVQVYLHVVCCLFALYGGRAESLRKRDSQLAQRVQQIFSA